MSAFDELHCIIIRTKDISIALIDKIKKHTKVVVYNEI